LRWRTTRKIHIIKNKIGKRVGKRVVLHLGLGHLRSRLRLGHLLGLPNNPYTQQGKTRNKSNPEETHNKYGHNSKHPEKTHNNTNNEVNTKFMLRLYIVHI